LTFLFIWLTVGIAWTTLAELPVPWRFHFQARVLRRERPWSAVGRVLLLYPLLIPLLVFRNALGWPWGPRGTPGGLALGWLWTAGVFVLVLLAARCPGESVWDVLGLGRHNLGRAVAIGLVLAAVAFMTGTTLWHAWGRLGALLTLPALLTLADVGPWVLLNEEAAFRGLGQGRFIEWLGEWPGIVLAALIFGLLHLPALLIRYEMPLAWVLRQVTLDVVTGLLFGVIVRRTGNVWATAIPHTVAVWLNLVW